ncbi:predicted protein [Naegleria gruberi]|uniref:Predicted protein n=1 Tax=Naegleria gruberi TaxID=5762 RepID=D2VCM4_NAEGR|nr:uncharacterized protein NAEGRDRAFT_66625 [Naegleria gruberi]EFC45332.1 predicted protein [Naegleria gruberi]|eukprot:XP_002678076.1 predicted protein [Naegleria gruberi strain NEG-M]
MHNINTANMMKSSISNREKEAATVETILSSGNRCDTLGHELGKENSEFERKPPSPRINYKKYVLPFYPNMNLGGPSNPSTVSNELFRQYSTDVLNNQDETIEEAEDKLDSYEPASNSSLFTIVGMEMLENGFTSLWQDLSILATQVRAGHLTIDSYRAILKLSLVLIIFLLLFVFISSAFVE